MELCKFGIPLTNPPIDIIIEETKATFSLITFDLFLSTTVFVTAVQNILDLVISTKILFPVPASI